MRIHFYSPVSFEPWNWENSVTTGIGGAETSVVEMSWRLARRGHDVTVYAPLPERSANEWRGVKWLPLKACTFSELGLWILYRCPQDVDKFIPKRTDQTLWLLLQDWDHPQEMWATERVERLDRIIALCEAHRRWLVNRHPEFKEKMWVTRNGIKVDLIESIASKVHHRNPKRIMYASSPDRGMLAALKIFKRAKEYVPDLELHLTYGFDNLDKLHATGNRHFMQQKQECLKLIEETGAVMYGRVSQNELYRMWFQAGMTVYCTSFWETGWITGLEAAAMGAIPIFSPIWAQGENMKHGIAVQGDPNDPLTIARFVEAVRHVASDVEAQEKMRVPMMRWARERWDWENFVTQWALAGEYDQNPWIEHEVNGKSYFLPNIPEFFWHDEELIRAKVFDLEPGDVFFDVGACAGAWTLPAAAIGAKVYAFEPGDETTSLDILQRAITRNGFDVTVVKKVVWSKTCNDLGKDGTRFVQGGKISAISLDDFVEQNSIDHIELLKIDVEGAELDVLDGACRFIEKYQPTVVVEAHVREGVTIDAVASRFQGWNMLDPIEGNGVVHLIFKPVKEMVHA